MSKFAERLKEARERAQLSQAGLAKRAGVSAGSIGNWESGTRETPRSLIALADALGVDPAWLAGEDRPAPRLSFNVKAEDPPAEAMTVGQVGAKLAEAIAEMSEPDRESLALLLSKMVLHGPNERQVAAIDALATVRVPLQLLDPIRGGGSFAEPPVNAPSVTGAEDEQEHPVPIHPTTEVGKWHSTEVTPRERPRREVEIDLDRPRAPLQRKGRP